MKNQVAKAILNDRQLNRKTVSELLWDPCGVDKLLASAIVKYNMANIELPDFIVSGFQARIAGLNPMEVAALMIEVYISDIEALLLPEIKNETAKTAR